MTKRTSRSRARHPGEGEWRAYLDGELSLRTRLSLRLHAARCRVCASRLQELTAVGSRVSQLLGPVPDPDDVAEAWARVAVVSGRPIRPVTWTPRSAFLAGGLSMATLAASILLLTPAPTRLLGRVHGIGAFANVLDHCCSTAGDGDAYVREGVFTLELPGLDAPVKVQYSDVDGSGDLSTGDIVRSISSVARR